MVGGGGRQVKLGEDVRDVLLHRARADPEGGDDAGIGAALGHQLEDLQLAGGEAVQRVIAAADQELGDDLGVQGGAAWGKAATLAAAAVAVSLPAALAAFLAGQSILGRQHLSVSLGQPGVVRAVIGSALYLAVAALLGLALGTLLRSTAGGIAVLFGLLFAVQIVAGFLPGSWSDDVGKFLPGTAGQAVTMVRPDPASSLPPWTGFGVFCGYTAVLLALAAIRMRRGDA